MNRLSKIKIPFLKFFLLIVTFLCLLFKEGIWAFLFAYSDNKEILQKTATNELDYALSVIINILLIYFVRLYIGKKNGITVKFPYFFPLPHSPIGIMGYFYSMPNENIDRRTLFDITFYGVVSSLIFSSICWIVGIYLSELVNLSVFSNEKDILDFGDSLFTYYTGQWILGPYNTETTTIIIHPLAKAGWVTLLMVSGNAIIIFGQFEGSRILFCLIDPKKYQKMFYSLVVILFIIAFLSFFFLPPDSNIRNFFIGYVFFLFALGTFTRLTHPEILNPDTLVDARRKLLGLILLIMLCLFIVPKPISNKSSMDKQEGMKQENRIEEKND